MCAEVLKSYVNDVEISMLRLHRHLQMLEMFGRKHTNRVASIDYFRDSV